jgi:hypothetical protein
MGVIKKQSQFFKLKYVLIFTLIFIVTFITYIKIGMANEGLSSMIISIILGVGTALVVIFSIIKYDIVVKINRFLVLAIFLLSSFYIFIVLPNNDRGLGGLLDVYIYVLIVALFIIYYLFHFLGKIKNNIIKKIIDTINKIINIFVFIFLILLGFYIIFYIILQS